MERPPFPQLPTEDESLDWDTYYTGNPDFVAYEAEQRRYESEHSAARTWLVAHGMAVRPAARALSLAHNAGLTTWEEFAAASAGTDVYGKRTAAAIRRIFGIATPPKRCPTCGQEIPAD